MPESEGANVDTPAGEVNQTDLSFEARDAANAKAVAAAWAKVHAHMDRIQGK